MSKPFDPTKPVQTRDGLPARIICTDRASVSPIGALVKRRDGHEDGLWYFPNGQLYPTVEAREDLINIPQKVTKYGLMDKDFNQLFGSVYDTEADAAKAVIFSRRVVTITWEE